MSPPNPMPFPVRIAAGLAATAVDSVRKLPGQLAGLPMGAASQLLQVSMRAQQQVTDLALRGDEVFAQFRAVEDEPPWARFDEDGEPAAEERLATVLAGPGGGHPRQQDGTSVTEPADTAQRAESDRKRRPTDAPPLPDYDELTLPQLRGKLRALSLQELEVLVEYERSHRARPPFVTMLSNRISTVRSQ